jgi:hypothetical protein
VDEPGWIWRGQGTGTCTVKLTLAVKGSTKKGKAKTQTIATANYSIPAGRTAIVALTLNAAGRSLLAVDRGRLSATLTILKSSPAPPQTHTKTVQLVQQKAHGRKTKK